MTTISVTPEAAAQISFAAIDQAAAYARQTTEVGGRALLVDGTAFSPSTRAVVGAEYIFQNGTDDEWEWYQDELDQLCDAYAEHGYSLGWDDGCLWLYGPQYDPDADA